MGRSLPLLATPATYIRPSEPGSVKLHHALPTPSARPWHIAISTRQPTVPAHGVNRVFSLMPPHRASSSFIIIRLRQMPPQSHYAVRRRFNPQVCLRIRPSEASCKPFQRSPYQPISSNAQDSRKLISFPMDPYLPPVSFSFIIKHVLSCRIPHIIPQYSVKPPG